MSKRDHIQESELYQLLMRAAPYDRFGRKTVPELARALGMSRWGVYKWLKHERIRPERVKQIVDISEGRVTLADFERYVYNF